MEDVLDVYERAYDPKNPVICMDEMSKQQVKEVVKSLPPRPGDCEKYDYHYERNGTSNLFMFSEPLKGFRWVKVTNRRTKVDWARVMEELANTYYPTADKITVVMDNLNTHRGSSFYESFEPLKARALIKRFDFHYTPVHGSWLNMAEIELSVLSRQCLNRRIGDQAILSAEVESWVAHRNKESVGINWQFTTDKARTKLKRLYPANKT